MKYFIGNEITENYVIVKVGIRQYLQLFHRISSCVIYFFFKFEQN